MRQWSGTNCLVGEKEGYLLVGAGDGQLVVELQVAHKGLVQDVLHALFATLDSLHDLLVVHLWWNGAETGECDFQSSSEGKMNCEGEISEKQPNLFAVQQEIFDGGHRLDDIKGDHEQDALGAL